MTTEAPPAELTPAGYRIAGRVYPRVSTILGVIHKPGLEAWKHRIGLDAAKQVSSEAAGLGTRVHEACEHFARKGFHAADLAPDLAPFVKPYEDWMYANVRRVVAVERTVHHARYGYAGTADLIADMKDGRRLLVDLKTSNSLDMTYRLQTAAYALALVEMGEPVEGRLIVQMPSRRPGTLRAVEYDDDARDIKTWLSVLRLYKWLRDHEHDWKATR